MTEEMMDPLAPMALPPARKYFLWLGIAAAALCVAVSAVLVAIAVVDNRQNLIQGESLDALQEQFTEQPDNATLQEAIRDIDIKVRARHFHNRSLAKAGGLLLLVAASVMVILLRLYGHVPPEDLNPEVLSRADLFDEEISSARKQRAVSSLIVAGLLVAAAFTVMSMVPSAPARAMIGADPPPEVDEPVTGTFAENWPQWRGPAGMGVVPAGDWPIQWDGAAETNVAWKTEIPESGKSSPVIWGNRIYLTGGSKKRQFVMCFSRDEGKLLWKSQVDSPARWKSEPDKELEDYGYTGFAAPTAVTNGHYVVAFFATNDIAAFDRKGNQVWAKNMGRPESMYGLAASLALYGDKVILQNDQGSEADGPSRIVAFDISSGKELWSTPRPVPNSWSSPVVIKTPERSIVVCCGDPFVIAYNPETGTELWRASGLSGDVAPSPIHTDGKILVTSDGAQVMAIKTGGSGDITKSHVAWISYDGMPDTASPITDGKWMLQSTSYGGANCLNVADGKEAWSEDIGGGSNASPTLVGAKVYLPDVKGVTYIFELGPKLAIEAKSSLGEAIDANPAFLDGRIYIRGAKHLFCIGGK